MNIEDIVKGMNLSQIKQRRKEISAELEKEGADIDALTKEVDLLEAREKEINEQIEKQEQLRKKLSKKRSIIQQPGMNTDRKSVV